MVGAAEVPRKEVVGRGGVSPAGEWDTGTVRSCVARCAIIYMFGHQDS